MLERFACQSHTHRCVRVVPRELRFALQALLLNVHRLVFGLLQLPLNEGLVGRLVEGNITNVDAALWVDDAALTSY